LTVYTFTPLDDPFANGGTSASGINNTGQIVGSYSVIGVSPITHQGYGFIYNRQDGTYTTLDDPLAVHGGVVPGTSAQGINDVGQVVGSYTGFFSDVGPSGTFGFLYSGGTYIALNVPGATQTYAYGINNAGQIAGYYTTGSVSHGFIYDGSTYTTLDDPLAGPGGTFAYGINNAGQIVGSYNDASGIGSHGFLYSVSVSNNAITGAAFLGTVGLDWQVSGFGDFSSRNEGDMLLRNVNTGGLELYDISNNQITGAFFLGNVGLDWQFAGVAPVHAPGASDLVLRNVNTGAFQVYNIANNQLTGSASLGAVGLDWQLGGFAAIAPGAAMGSSDASTSQLVQAMAGFAGGTGAAADGSNAGFVNADTSQQPFLTTPQHA
jgi:hypothetical protein